jgi:hypothetical protein
MNYAAGKLQKPVTDALRALVVEDLPEMMDIADQELRAKSIEVSTPEQRCIGGPE